MRKKRAIVTGGAGFIGSFLCERLVEEGWEVLCIDNFLTGREENVESLKRNPQFHLEDRDVCDVKTVKGQVDLICHFASPASPKDYLKFPVETMLVGSLGTYRMLEIARDKGAQFVLASTSEVYGDPLVTPQREDYWGNVNPTGPRAVYDEAKRFAEAMAAAYYRNFSLRVKIARIFNTYGPRMRQDDGRVIPAFISACLRREPLPVFGDGSQTRSFCYVDDLIEGIWRFVELDSNFEVINLGNPEEMKIMELAELIQAIAGVKLGVKFFPLPENDPKRRCPDISKAKELLNWKPRVSIEEGLRKTLEYFRKRM